MASTIRSGQEVFLTSIFRKDVLGNLVWTIPQGEFYSVTDDLLSLLVLLSGKGPITLADILELGFTEQSLIDVANLGIISFYHKTQLSSFNALSSTILSDYKYPPPTSIEWYPSFNCNQLCTFCYINSINKSSYVASKSDIDKFLKNIEGSGILKIALLGGEPTIWTGTEYFLRSTLTGPYDISFSTNGLTIPQSILKVASKHPTLQLTFSIHSGSADEHDRVVGINGAFKKVFENIRLYNHTGKHCCVACVYNSEIEETYESLIRHCSKFNIKSISFLYQQFENYSSSENSYFMLFEKFISKAKSIGSEYNISINAPNRFAFLSPYRKVEFSKRSPRAEWLYGFKEGKTRIEITPEGNVYPSFRMFGNPNFFYGNIYSDKLENIWSKTKLHNLIFDREIPVKCKSCEFYYICGGGNIFKNSIKGGKFIKTYPHCPKINN